MSLLSEHIIKHPEDTKRLIGIDYLSLQQLIDQALLDQKALQSKNEQSKKRIIAAGGGRKPSLSDRDEILLTLAYLRQHTTFQWLGLMFNVSEATANNIFHYWLKILSPTLPPSLLEEFQDEDEHEEILDALSDIELIVDSTEQPRQRPQDKEEREKLYSGYKHNYTSKNFHSSS
jgi:Helix-turn-helix of DDE superfamily endonuclease